MRLQPFLHWLSVYLVTECSLLVGAQLHSPYPKLARGESHAQRKRAPGPQGPVLDAQTDMEISNILSAWGVSGGVGVAVVRQDEEGNWIEERKGYGNANLEGTAITDETRFLIGSNSKLFTAIAAGMLTHEESADPSLQWHSKIASVFPEWELMDPVASQGSTIKDLITHRTGLPRHDSMYSIDDTVETILPRLKYLRPSAEFRDTWQYNNIMYSVLSGLPAQVLPGKPSLSQYVTQKIFQPLGMNHTTYSYNSAKASGQLATSITRYDVDFTENPTDAGTPREMVPLPHPWEDNTISVGPSGVIMSLVDASTWLKTLLLGGRHPETLEQVIPADVLETVSSGISAGGFTFLASLMPQHFSNPVYGGGQASYTYRGFNIIEHGGSDMGYHSEICRLPYDGIGIAVFTNDGLFGPFIYDIVKSYLIDRALNLEPIDWSEQARPIMPSALVGGPPTPRPSPAVPPLVTFPSIAGAYVNPGYGPVELCYIPPYSNATIEASPACRDLVEQAPIILPGMIDPSIPTYVASWDKASSSHVLVMHFNENIFNATALFSVATNDTAEPYFTHPAFQPATLPATLKFAQIDGNLGFAITGLWGAAPPARTGNVKDDAEVWFERV